MNYAFRLGATILAPVLTSILALIYTAVIASIFQTTVPTIVCNLLKS